MSGPDWYVTQAMQTIVETRPVAAALEDWIRLAAAGPARDARTVEALAIVDRLGKFMAFEGMVADEAEDTPNVVPIFERRARAAGHPSAGGEFDYRRARGAAVGPEPAEDIIRRLRDGDDCSAHGLPRPELGLTAEGSDLARQEMRHEITSGSYYGDDDGA